jgi:hypothetical protein
MRTATGVARVVLSVPTGHVDDDVGGARSVEEVDLAAPPTLTTTMLATVWPAT